jgi:molecular chaperone GrpE
MSVKGSDNQAALGMAAEKDGTEVEEKEVVRVSDKRRFAADGEPVNPAATAAELAAEVEQWRERCAEAERKREESERALREFSEKFGQARKEMQAENESMRQRIQRNFELRLETAKGDIITSLLDSLDNLKRAIAAAEKSDSKEAEFRALLTGVKATAGMFEARMREHGLSPVPSDGVEFNPEIHEAVEIVMVARELDNHVVAEFQPGYMFGEKLLRPARVRVGRAID